MQITKLNQKPRQPCMPALSGYFLLLLQKTPSNTAKTRMAGDFFTTSYPQAMRQHFFFFRSLAVLLYVLLEGHSSVAIV